LSREPVIGILASVMPRCERCHSQWATFFRCPHCEAKFPCMKQFSLVSAAVFAIVLAIAYVLSSFTHKVENWQAVKKTDPVVEQSSLSVEIDKSGVE